MITRDNYEEFFLLYVDNELSATDKELVERFVAGNPDLAEEWEAFLQCRLEPERFIFPSKEELIKEEDEPWPEKLFEPDLGIVFPGKESLYRHEKDRRIVFYPRWRIAAAAALLLIAAGGYFFLSVKKQDQRLAIGVSEKNITPPVTPATTASLYPSENTEKKKQEVKPASTIEKEDSPASTNKKRTDPVIAQTGTNKQKGTNKKTPETRVVGPTALPQLITRQEDKGIAAIDPTEITRPERTIAVATKAVTAPEDAISKENSSFATQALLNNATAANDDNYYGAEPASQRKNKLRGLFRRASRVFEKSADRDDDGQRKVLIGAFQIALK
jgi:hypothetical protein